jgi:hypothetical protein
MHILTCAAEASPAEITTETCDMYLVAARVIAELRCREFGNNAIAICCQFLCYLQTYAARSSSDNRYFGSQIR